jgi:hypothetical protein
MVRALKPSSTSGEPPKEFEIRRDLPLGRHPILTAFPTLDRLPTARRLEPDATKRAPLFESTEVEIVSEDMWMYVAPRKKIPGTPRRWNPVVSADADCIVIGEGHLRESPATTLFMDIYHELCHVRQRRDGADLYDRSVGYTERWTEVEAYRFVVDEARQFGVSDEYLRDYLKVEWISEKEHRSLLHELGVPVG